MIDNIRGRASDFTRWVGRQVVGKEDFSSGDSRTRDYAVIGTATGAVAGAAIGTITGFKAQSSNSIKEVWVDKNIVHPEMRGYTHHTTPDFSTECVDYNSKESRCERTETNLDGWWHSYSPNIQERVVGQYNEPTFRNTNGWEPLKGGALGAIGGGLVGLGVGLGLAALERSLKGESLPARPKLSPETEKALLSRTGVAAVAGTAVGAGIGAYVGSQAGVAELASQQTHTRVWNIPVTETQTLGYTPSSHYEHNWFGSTWASPSNGNRNETVPVNRQVPLYNGGGSPRLQGTQKVFTTNRYGPLFGGIAGGAIGAGVGLAAGLAVGLTDKLLTERKETKEANLPAA